MKLIIRFARHRHRARFVVVLEVPMNASLPNWKPTIKAQQLQHLPHFY
jgi:hypothetical protein